MVTYRAKAILQQALKTIGESFFGLTADRLKFWEKIKSLMPCKKPEAW
jgi:hypothetical protein